MSVHRFSRGHFSLPLTEDILHHVGRDLLIPSSESYLCPLSPHLNLPEVRAFLVSQGNRGASLLNV